MVTLVRLVCHIVLAVGGPGHALLLLVKGGTVATCDPSSLNTGAHKFFMDGV